MTLTTIKIGKRTWSFTDLKTLMAKATPARSGDELAGLAAGSAEERIAAKMALSEVPLATFLSDPLVPYEDDEVTRLIVDSHDSAAFAPLKNFSVGEFRNWLLGDSTSGAELAKAAPGITPEMVAAVSKLMRNQDLVAVAAKCSVEAVMQALLECAKTLLGFGFRPWALLD